MTDLEDDFRYYGLTHTQAARHRTRVVRYWANRARYHSDKAQRLARLAILLALAAAGLAAWELFTA
jgi:hypothetical protein